MVGVSSRKSFMLAALISGAMACGDPQSLPCEERDEVAAELPRVSLVIGEEVVSAEVADEEDERATAWAGRRCDLDALLWIPMAIEAPSVPLCGVEIAVDLAFVRDAQIIALEFDVAACHGTCEDCPNRGEGGPEVDAMLWFPAGQVDVALGDTIAGLDAVTLPTEP